MIDLYNKSHVTFYDLRLYKGEKTQQDRDNMTSVSGSSEVQKNWPRKRFQINKNKSVQSAMMCWESLEDSEREERTKKTIDQDKETNDTSKSKTTKKMMKNMSRVQYIWGTN